ncbi:MAG: tetratricopeptide repeat protein, partial [Candidatus Macondimonas sp.]
LGYFLAVHTDRLQEAQDLIQRALAMNPDNPAILDSLGWVYFRQGDLEAADRYLVQAYEQLSDPEVAAHLGELRWRQGRRGEAREIWGKAHSAFPDHPILRQTLRRYGQE